MGSKVYVVSCSECHEYSEENYETKIIGVYTSSNLAEEIARKYMNTHYRYDVEWNRYEPRSLDEVIMTIEECDLDRNDVEQLGKPLSTKIIFISEEDIDEYEK